MRVLLTANRVSTWTGVDLYTAEVAQGLQRRGHDVAVHAVLAGPLAHHLQQQRVPLVRRPARAGWRPDVIHAQGRVATRSAMAIHDGVPVLFVAHGHDRWNDVIPPHPSIRRYAGVSKVCVDAQLHNGAPPDRTVLLANFVDTTTFATRPPLPPTPRRALMFSNYARAGGYLDAVEAACRRKGLQLDRLGAGTGTATAEPSDVLPGYDVVFAKGRAAIEALAVGCAVVLCDFAGVGPMVTLAEFDRLRAANFGFAALTRPHDPDVLCDEIEKYDPRDASAVSTRIRSEASLDSYLDHLERLYQVIVEEQAHAPRTPAVSWTERTRASSVTLAWRAYHRLPTQRRLSLRPLTRLLLRAP